MNICPCCKTSHDSTACPTPIGKGLDAMPCSVTDSGAKIIHREDVMLALMEIGLGAKLVNEAIQKLGFPLDQFPSQNTHDMPPEGLA